MTQYLFQNSYQVQLNKDIPIDEFMFQSKDSATKETGKAKKIEFIEHLFDMVTLTKSECALIQVRSNPQGTQVFDLPENIKRQTGPNRTKRDSYTAMLIGNWGIKVYFDMMNAKHEEYSSTFTPTLI